LSPENEESLIANREKWTSKRREHLQLIVGPLDCGEGVSKRDDFFAIVKGAPTDKNVRDSSQLCEFRFNPARDSDLMSAAVPI
jgi:hypothetical protein